MELNSDSLTYKFLLKALMDGIQGKEREARVELVAETKKLFVNFSKFEVSIGISKSPSLVLMSSR